MKKRRKTELPLRTELTAARKKLSACRKLTYGLAAALAGWN